MVPDDYVTNQTQPQIVAIAPLIGHDHSHAHVNAQRQPHHGGDQPHPLPYSQLQSSISIPYHTSFVRTMGMVPCPISNASF